MSETRGVKGRRMNSRPSVIAICRSTSPLDEPWMILTSCVVRPGMGKF